MNFEGSQGFEMNFEGSPHSPWTPGCSLMPRPTPGSSLPLWKSIAESESGSKFPDSGYIDSKLAPKVSLKSHKCGGY